MSGDKRYATIKHCTYVGQITNVPPWTGLGSYTCGVPICVSNICSVYPGRRIGAGDGRNEGR